MKRYLWYMLLFLVACSDESASLPEEIPSDIMLPMVSIYTAASAPIISKEEYLAGHLQVISEDTNQDLMADLRIRGRGNSTWLMPKKSYQINLDAKQSMLDMPKDKKWLFLANYSDKTMLRNEVALHMSRLSNLDWTPESRFVELELNDEYQGLYQVTQKVEESSNRVDIGKDGFLLEVTPLYRLDDDDVYFETDHYLFNVKEPKLDKGDYKYNQIQSYVRLVENAIFGNDFNHPTEGYAKYIDVSSFVDWYLINEITKNNDAAFYTSVYLNYVPGGKLKMGPVWDFDLSMGNINYNDNETPEGFWIKSVAWYARLFEDPVFLANVKSRFEHFYNSRELLLEAIDMQVSQVNHAQQRNFVKWPILGEYVWPNHVYFPTYEEEVIYLKEWLSLRFEWLNEAIAEL